MDADPFDRLIAAHASLNGDIMVTKDGNILRNYPMPAGNDNPIAPAPAVSLKPDGSLDAGRAHDHAHSRLTRRSACRQGMRAMQRLAPQN